MWTFALLAGRREAAAGDSAVLQGGLESQSPRLALPFPSLRVRILAACPRLFVLVGAAAPGVYS